MAKNLSTIIKGRSAVAGADTQEIFMLVGLFCWAVQKFYAITRPLSNAEINELHNAFVGTMEIYV